MDKRLISIAEIVRNHVTASDKFDSNLECACAISSYYFRKIAKLYDYQIKLHEGGCTYDKFYDLDTKLANHCWNSFKDSIIDLTATQFGNYAPIYITNLNNPAYHEFRTEKESIVYIKKHWPYFQSPTKMYKYFQPLIQKAQTVPLRRFIKQ